MIKLAFNNLFSDSLVCILTRVVFNNIFFQVLVPYVEIWSFFHVFFPRCDHCAVSLTKRAN